MDRIQVKVVRRLVEQQRLRMAEQSLREQYADFLSTLQFSHFAAVQFLMDIEALQQNGGIALGGVSVFFADDAFEFAEFHPVFVGHVVLGVDRVALLHSRPEAFVAHDDAVDRRVRVKGKLVLAEDAELARADHGAFLRLHFAAQQLHECRLSGPIGTGQAIAFAWREGRGNFFKQNFGAVAH